MLYVFILQIKLPQVYNLNLILDLQVHVHYTVFHVKKKPISLIFEICHKKSKL